MFNITEEQVNQALIVAGALVPLTSALASALNHVIREKQANKEPVSVWLLGFASLLNFLSVNVDKALQLRRLMRGQPAPVTEPAAEAPEPAPVLCAKCSAAAVTCSKCGEPITP